MLWFQSLLFKCCNPKCVKKVGHQERKSGQRMRLREAIRGERPYVKFMCSIYI
jgi:hypothetical protein